MTAKVVEIAVSALATVTAAFGGAWLAFYFSIRARRRDVDNERVAAGHRALFALLRQFNTLHNIRTQFIDAYREDGIRLVNMPALAPRDVTHLRVDLNALTFLLETDQRQVLGELMAGDEAFFSTMQAIEQRSNLHLQRVQPILANSDLQRGDAITPQAIKSLLGGALYSQLELATDDVVDYVDRTLRLIQQRAMELRTALLTLYPDRVFIRFMPKEEQ